MVAAVGRLATRQRSYFFSAVSPFLVLVSVRGTHSALPTVMNEKLDQLREAMSDFKTAMLVTHDAEQGLRARPLEIAECDSDGKLWFFTASDSGKVVEIQRDANVAVVMQAPRRFISVSGSARFDSSLERRRQLWRESFRPWFPGGAEDPNAVALEVVPVSAELWDLRGKNGLEYALHAITAVVSGKRASDKSDGGYHVEVQEEFE